ncbi:FHA domain-containing protein [Nocardia sp. NPDC051570]|uniref:FHA domain-containing protein n=1 Tax=Nocardia sp. NPDC051570 TaxID=3364324 RepID=UPI0037AD470C
MRDRQVEIVAGNHVAVRVAGALVLVAHREPGRVGARSPALRAAEALARLVSEAAGQTVGSPGRSVAREVSRWLMREAERLSPRRPVELGILAPVDTGGLAILLHGGVTAMLSGARGVEYHRGVDAAFTVDRVALPPERAAALFVDDERGRIPELPPRGIGSLVEGIAPAAGAIVWFEGERPPEPALAGPHGGTNPAPAPDPELERRLEATARATALTVKVLGFRCARAHPSDPRSAFCTVCGMPVDQTQQPAEVVRPPLGLLLLDDGMTYLLAADAVLGRDPEHSEAVGRGLVPLKIDDTSGGMSRAHAEIHLVNWDVLVVDRGSTNGTRARLPGYRDWIRLQPNQPLALVHGAEVMLGNRVLRYEPAAPPPFG